MPVTYLPKTHVHFRHTSVPPRLSPRRLSSPVPNKIDPLHFSSNSTQACKWDIRLGNRPGEDQLPETLPELLKLASVRWIARKNSSEIRCQSDRSEGSVSSRGNHRARGRNRRDRCYGSSKTSLRFRFPFQATNQGYLLAKKNQRFSPQY